MAGLAFSEDIAARYDMTDPWHFQGDLTLVRLDPVGGDGAARPRASCDTVPPPDVLRKPAEKKDPGEKKDTKETKSKRGKSKSKPPAADGKKRSTPVSDSDDDDDDDATQERAPIDDK